MRSYKENRKICDNCKFNPKLLKNIQYRSNNNIKYDVCEWNTQPTYIHKIDEYVCVFYLPNNGESKYPKEE